MSQPKKKGQKPRIGKPPQKKTVKTAAPESKTGQKTTTGGPSERNTDKTAVPQPKEEQKTAELIDFDLEAVMRNLDPDSEDVILPKPGKEPAPPKSKDGGSRGRTGITARCKGWNFFLISAAASLIVCLVVSNVTTGDLNRGWGNWWIIQLLSFVGYAVAYSDIKGHLTYDMMSGYLVIGIIVFIVATAFVAECAVPTAGLLVTTYLRVKVYNGDRIRV